MMFELLLPTVPCAVAVLTFWLVARSGRDGGEAFWLALGALAFTVLAIALVALAFARD